MIPLEKKQNRRAGNWHFNKKQEDYAKSQIAEVQELMQLQEWTPQECQERHERIVNRLIEFFERK